MIKRFEDFTEDLSEKDEVALKAVVKILKTAKKKEDAITNKKLSKMVYRINHETPKMRKLIAFIRVNDIIPRLIASSNGYYIGKNKKDVEEYIESLSERISAIRSVSKALKNQLKTM